MWKEPQLRGRGSMCYLLTRQRPRSRWSVQERRTSNYAVVELYGSTVKTPYNDTGFFAVRIVILKVLLYLDFVYKTH